LLDIHGIRYTFSDWDFSRKQIFCFFIIRPKSVNEKMITHEQAKALVEKEINEPVSSEPGQSRLVILDKHTIEKEWGWVFFYNTQEYAKSGNIMDTLVGNAPYIVNKNTGELIETGTAYDIEEYIKDYEEKL
jgi:hypothetical protein